MSGETVDLGCGSIQEYDVRVDVDEQWNPDVVWDLEETPLPFETDEFENAVAVHVLEHLENDLDVLEEMKRISSGSVVVVVPIGERPRTDDHERELGKEEWLERYNPDDYALSSMASYYDLVLYWG